MVDRADGRTDLQSDDHGQPADAGRGWSHEDGRGSPRRADASQLQPGRVLPDDTSCENDAPYPRAAAHEAVSGIGNWPCVEGREEERADCGAEEQDPRPSRPSRRPSLVTAAPAAYAWAFARTDGPSRQEQDPGRTGRGRPRIRQRSPPTPEPSPGARQPSRGPPTGGPTGADGRGPQDNQHVKTRPPAPRRIRATVATEQDPWPHRRPLYTGNGRHKTRPHRRPRTRAATNAPRPQRSSRDLARAQGTDAHPQRPGRPARTGARTPTESSPFLPGLTPARGFSPIFGRRLPSCVSPRRNVPNRATWMFIPKQRRSSRRSPPPSWSRP